MRNLIFTHRLVTDSLRSWVVSGCLTELWCWDACAQPCWSWLTDQFHSLVLTWLVAVSLPSGHWFVADPDYHHRPFALCSLLGSSRAVPLFVGARPCLVLLYFPYKVTCTWEYFGSIWAGRTWPQVKNNLLQKGHLSFFLNNKLHRQLNHCPGSWAVSLFTWTILL